MNNQKKILILGGSDIQVSAIKKAKEMGHYVITCDYLPDNPGHKFADEYHNISTTLKDDILAISQKLDIDGILAYASDPGALTAAYVAEKMNLPTNPYRSVELLSRKDLFRNFLNENGFNAPKAKGFDNYKEAYQFAQNLGRKAIVKPVDSSGSKGVFTIDKGENFEKKFSNALSFSRTGLVIMEEFINKKGFQIGGDGFAVNGELVFRCFGDLHFSSTNPLLPCSLSVPTLHNKRIVEKVHSEVQRLLAKIGFKDGAMNFDIIVDENDEVYILEIGARNGGNMIPELTKLCTGVDMKAYSIRSCLDMDCSDLKMTYEKKYFAHYVVHSEQVGKVKSVCKSPQLSKCILYEHYNFQQGDFVKKYMSSANRLGILLLKFNSPTQMDKIIYNMDKNFILNF